MPIQVTINERGVEKVTLHGDGWEQEEEALWLYNLIRPALRQIDEAVKGGKRDTLH